MEQTAPRLEKNIIKDLNISFNYIDKAYQALKKLIDNEGDLKEKERTELYSYGLDRATLDLVRLSNIKKGLEAINKNNLKKMELPIDILLLTSHYKIRSFFYGINISPKDYCKKRKKKIKAT